MAVFMLLTLVCLLTLVQRSHSGDGVIFSAEHVHHWQVQTHEPPPTHLVNAMHNRITLQIRTLGLNWDLSLRLYPVFAENATIISHLSGKRTILQPRHHSFEVISAHITRYGQREHLVSGSVTFSHDQRHFHAVLVTEEHVYSVDKHRQETSEGILGLDNGTSLILHHLDESQMDDIETSAFSHIRRNQIAHRRRRRRMQGTIVIPEQMSQFTNCFDGQDRQLHQTRVMLVTDEKMNAQYGNNASVIQSEIEAYFSDMAINSIFKAQLRIENLIGTIIIGVSFSDTTVSHDATCSVDAIPRLQAFRSWRQAIYDQGEPHGRHSAHYLITGCHHYGTVGMAYVTGLCTNPYSVAFSGHIPTSNRNWLRMTHELGHLFGARHTPDGIMKPVLSSGEHNGTIQFAPLNKAHMCDHLKRITNSAGGRYYMTTNECFTYAPLPVIIDEGAVGDAPPNTCGDGILDNSEECDWSVYGGSCCARNCSWVKNCSSGIDIDDITQDRDHRYLFSGGSVHVLRADQAVESFERHPGFPTPLRLNEDFGIKSFTSITGATCDWRTKYCFFFDGMFVLVAGLVGPGEIRELYPPINMTDLLKNSCSGVNAAAMSMTKSRVFLMCDNSVLFTDMSFFTYTVHRSTIGPSVRALLYDSSTDDAVLIRSSSSNALVAERVRVSETPGSAVEVFASHPVFTGDLDNTIQTHSCRASLCAECDSSDDHTCRVCVAGMDVYLRGRRCYHANTLIDLDMDGNTSSNDAEFVLGGAGELSKFSHRNHGQRRTDAMVFERQSVLNLKPTVNQFIDGFEVTAFYFPRHCENRNETLLSINHGAMKILFQDCFLICTCSMKTSSGTRELVVGRELVGVGNDTRLNEGAWNSIRVEFGAEEVLVTVNQQTLSPVGVALDLGRKVKRNASGTNCFEQWQLGPGLDGFLDTVFVRRVNGATSVAVTESTSNTSVHFSWRVFVDNWYIMAAGVGVVLLCCVGVLTFRAKRADKKHECKSPQNEVVSGHIDENIELV